MANSDNAVSNALATVGTVLWCIQLIPQIFYNWKRKDCTGLPPVMMFLWVISGIPFAIYFCIIDINIALQVQPHLFTFFCGVSFVQSCYYPPVQLPKKKIITITLLIIAVDTACEVGFIIWLRPLYAKGVKWPALIFGIIASVLLAIGLLPPYFELAKRQGRVVGINFLFLTLDSLGAYFSIASVAVGELDILGIILYVIIAALELGIFVSHFIWCCRFKWFSKTEFVDDNNKSNDADVVIQEYNELDLNVKKESEYDNKKHESHIIKVNANYEDEQGNKHLEEFKHIPSRLSDFKNDKNKNQFPYFDDNASMIRSVHGISVQRAPTDYSNVYTSLGDDNNSG